MAGDDAQKDRNFVNSLLAVSSVDGKSTVKLYADPTTHRLLTSGGAVSTSMQKDQFTATNNQTTFVPSKTVVYDFYMSIMGAIQTPSTDYSIIGGNYVLNSGVPQGSIIILLYSTT